ncbi:MAG: hypothetical protein KC483_10985 [Nitrosarchaeum sp.]|nr:hypothetical protein [Nitrosarchaeum sp.]
MVKPIVLIAGAIPVIIAVLIALPLITKPEIPFSASTPADRLEIEYTKHQLKKISYGVTERIGAQKTEILVVKNDGEIRYSLTEGGYPNPDIKSKLDSEQLKKIKALIKETGFITIPAESFPIMDNVTEYQKSSVKVTLNGRVNQIFWPEQSATSKFIPPIITMVESQLDEIVEQVRE